MIRVSDLSKVYRQGNNEIIANDKINIHVESGEFVSIVGASGSGKSTLMNIIGGLEKATSGEVYISKIKTNEMNDEELTVFRRKNIGFIFQNFNLIPYLDVFNNIILPIALDNKKVNDEYINCILKKLDIENKKNSMINELSGGQQQRVAIARALSTKPKILLADEPTGNLDNDNTIKVINLLKSINKEFKQTIIMITHDMSIAKLTDRVIILSDGKVVN